MANLLMPWGGGFLFAFSALDGETDFSEGLVLRSALGGFALEVKRPQESGVLRLGACAPTGVDFGGDYIVSGGVKAAFLDSHHFLAEGTGLEVEFSEEHGAIRFLQKGPRVLVGVAKYFDASLIDADLDDAIFARRGWLDGLSLPWDPVLRKACSQLKTQILSGEGAIRHLWSTPDRWPHSGMWIWDSAFHAIGLRHLDLHAAREILLAVLDSQKADGFVPHMARPAWSSEVTQPPVLGYAASKLQEIGSDQAFLSEFYGKNGRFLEWILANRDTDGQGLVEWKIEGDPHCRCGESGMDNSARFDGATQLDAPDFNAFLARECGIMADFAENLGKPQDALRWRVQHDRLNRLMNELLWDEEYGLYFDRDVKTGRLSNVASSAGFLPLVSGAPTRQQVQRLVANLRNPRRFGTPVPLPSLSREQPEFSTDMWRGPVWTNINLMVAEALRQYGFEEDAQWLAKTTQDTVRKYARKYGTFFEFYDADDALPPVMLMRKGFHDDTALHQPLRDYGWTATLYLDQSLRE